MITPIQAFIQWFDGQPGVLKQGLAHIFLVSTTEDTRVMTEAPNASCARFRLWVQKGDFPLRSAARIFYIRSVFDLVILHHKEILKDECSDLSGIIALSGRQWEILTDSWIALRNKELSDAYVHSWASHVIGARNKEVC